MRRLGSSRWFVALLAVVLSGCSPAFEGALEPIRNSPLTAEQALGDFTTIDYCGFLELGYSGLDGVRVLDERRGFHHCWMTVEDSAGVSANVLIGELADESYNVLTERPDETVTHQRGLRTQRYSDIWPDSCDRFLLFPDDISLQISGLGEETAKEVQCSIASVVAEGVRHRVESGKPVARLEFGSNSFGAVDACATAAGEEVAAALGEPAEPRIPPSGHWCLWGRYDLPEPSAMVKFRLDDPLQVSADGEPEVIAGRDSVVRAEEPGSCSVRTQHIAADQLVPGTVEIASVFVRQVFTKDACTAARELAAVVWKTLPSG